MRVPTTAPAPVWTARTPDERRRVGVAALVAQVMSQPEGHRYAAAYGVLAGLVTSRTETMSTTWARDFARQIEAAMAAHPFDRRGSTS